MDLKIFIDPGHGGGSIGAAYRGRREQDDVLRLSLAVADRLKQVDGVEVKLSRETNVNPSINERCALANAWGADYFVSVHRNAFAPEKACGAESWVWSRVKDTGATYAAAKRLTDALAEVGFRNRGVKKGAPAYADYGVNRLTNMSSCLLECGFIDNSGDNAIFDGRFDEMADALAKALCDIVDAPWTGDAEKAPAKGDLDGDGKISAADARTALRMAIGLEKPSPAADCDGDGTVSVADAREILRKALEGDG